MNNLFICCFCGTGLVALPAILHKVMSDTSLTRNFGELRGLLQSMLQVCLKFFILNTCLICRAKDVRLRANAFANDQLDRGK
jgi:hypothetical protein